MNILYISQRLPYPPNKGEKIRAFHQIQHLSKRHAVHLACLVNDREDLQHVKNLEKYCASIDVVYRDKRFNECLAVLGLITNKPLSVAYFYSRELKKKITRRLGSKKFDRIFVYSSAMAEYVRNVSGIPKLMDFVDVDSEKWRHYSRNCPAPLSWIYRLEANQLAKYEEGIAKSFDHSIFVSDIESQLFCRRVNGRLISVIPNGVDLDYYAPNADYPCSMNQSIIVFTGSMDYFPNVDAVRYFCKEVFPTVKEAVPESQFHIVGRNPTRQVSALARRSDVIVTGSVPDVRPYLAKAKLAVAPFRIARGVQNKILEAMAMRLPVVGTSLAFQGIQATSADGVRIADDAKGFAQEVSHLLKDHDLYLRCSLQARNYVERQHRWEDHGTRLESFLQQVA